MLEIHGVVGRYLWSVFVWIYTSAWHWKFSFMDATTLCTLIRYSTFMVKAFFDHWAALASGDFAIWWCHHFESTRLLLWVKVLANIKRCCRQPSTATYGTKQTSWLCSQSMGPCLKIHEWMLQKVCQLAAVKTEIKTMRTMVTAVTANHSKSIACMLAKSELPLFPYFCSLTRYAAAPFAPQHTSNDHQHQHNSESVPAIAWVTTTRIRLHLYESCQLVAHMACIHITLQPRSHLFASAELLRDHRSLAWLQTMSI